MRRAGTSDPGKSITALTQQRSRPDPRLLSSGAQFWIFIWFCLSIGPARDFFDGVGWLRRAEVVPAEIAYPIDPDTLELSYTWHGVQWHVSPDDPPGPYSSPTGDWYYATRVEQPPSLEPPATPIDVWIDPQNISSVVLERRFPSSPFRVPLLLLLIPLFASISSARECRETKLRDGFWVARWKFYPPVIARVLWVLMGGIFLVVATARVFFVPAEVSGGYGLLALIATTIVIAIGFLRPIGRWSRGLEELQLNAAPVHPAPGSEVSLELQVTPRSGARIEPAEGEVHTYLQGLRRHRFSFRPVEEAEVPAESAESGRRGPVHRWVGTLRLPDTPKRRLDIFPEQLRVRLVLVDSEGRTSRLRLEWAWPEGGRDRALGSEASPPESPHKPTPDRSEEG